MLKNYFKIAFRNIAKNKVFGVINTLGLAIGISACLLIYIVIHYELSYDNFHPDKERIFRIVSTNQEGSAKKDFIISVPDPAAKVIRSTVLGLESVAMFRIFEVKVSISQGGQPIRRFFPSSEEGAVSPIILAEPQYFEIFKYDWLIGNPATALSEPFQVVLSENEARKYFGALSLDQVMGKEIIYDDSLRMKVTGIVKDWKMASDYPFMDFLSYSTVHNSFLKNHGNWDNWGDWNSNTQVFVKLGNHSTAAQVNLQFSKIVKANIHMPPQFQTSFLLQPLSDIHFNNDYRDYYIRKAHLPTLYGLMGIAAFILIIAAINFINLSTAQSVQRAREIGIRKVLGSSRKGIIFQFFCEIFLLTLFAVALSLLVMKPVIYLFNDLLPPGIKLSLYNPTTIGFLLALTLLTTVLAGFYPAKVLSAYLPVISLKGEGSQQVNQRGYLRKALIVFQFTVSLVFIIATLVIGNQIRYMLNENMGFSKEAILNIETNGNDPGTKVKVLANRIKGLSGVQMVSLNDGPPATHFQGGTVITYNNKAQVQTDVLTADENYLSLYQLKLIAGRNLTNSDTIRELMVNASCAKAMGFKTPEEAIGKLVEFGFGNGTVSDPLSGGWREVKRPIVGVVADFHSKSLHELIGPVTFVTQIGGTIAIKLRSGNLHPEELQSDLGQIAKAWNVVYPNDPFEYRILDEEIAKFYDSYRKTNQIMNTAMFIAIFISCMGLFGLAAFTAAQRRKEIGVRKVLGATVTSIVALLSKDFGKLVLLSLVLASPIAWFFMSDWLNDFAYRIKLSWWIFLAAGSIALFISLATVSFQAIKAAVANPVKSLRTE